MVYFLDFYFGLDSHLGLDSSSVPTDFLVSDFDLLNYSVAKLVALSVAAVMPVVLVGEFLADDHLAD